MMDFAPLSTQLTFTPSLYCRDNPDRFQRQQTTLAPQTLQKLWARHDLAQAMGQQLGTSAVLL
jgi:hypothetical protein